MEENIKEPVKLEENWRNPDGTMKPGHPGLGGRPKGKTLKEYQAQKFREMTDEEKEQWLKDNKLNPDTIWRMAEGNPQSDIMSGGEKIVQVPIYGNQSIPKHTSDQKDIPTPEENPSSGGGNISK